jgi:hypothetical protein
MGTRSFPGVKRPGRGADHPPLLALRSRKSKAIPLPISPLWAFGSVTGSLYLTVNDRISCIVCRDSDAVSKPVYAAFIQRFVTVIRSDYSRIAAEFKSAALMLNELSDPNMSFVSLTTVPVLFVTLSFIQSLIARYSDVCESGCKAFVTK